MKYFILFLIVCGFISTDVEAQTRTSSPPLTIQEEDASPTGSPRTLKVTNGSLTDNGDGTFSLSSAGGSSEWTDQGTYLEPNEPLADSVSIGQNLTVGNNVLYVDTSSAYVGINTANPTTELQVVGGVNLDSGTFILNDTNNRVGINIAAPTVDLEINQDVSIGNDLTVGRDFYIGTGATTRKSNNKVGIAVAATNPTANTFYSVEIPTELIAGTNFIVEDIIFNRDATQTGSLTVTAGYRTDPSGSITTLELLPTITASDYRVEDDGTLTATTVAGDNDIGFFMGLDTTAKVSVIFVGHYE